MRRSEPASSWYGTHTCKWHWTHTNSIHIHTLTTSVYRSAFSNYYFITELFELDNCEIMMHHHDSRDKLMCVNAVIRYKPMRRENLLSRNLTQAFNFPAGLPEPDFKPWKTIHYLLRLASDRCTNDTTWEYREISVPRIGNISTYQFSIMSVLSIS